MLIVVMVTVLRVVLLVLYKESMNGGGIDVCDVWLVRRRKCDLYVLTTGKDEIMLDFMPFG
jgi:hypothetical protein